MAIIDVLKRRDGATVVVAILIAMALTQPLSMIGGKLTSLILSSEEGSMAFYYAPPGTSWYSIYAQAIVYALVQLALIELAIRLYGFVKPSLTKKGK